jgi:hypothetical protein
MCFSAEASFGVGAVLLPAGLYCVNGAVQYRVAYLPLGIIPIIFAIQQFAEGLVWVGLDHNYPALVEGSALIFLLFALSFWPFWMPFSVLFLEPRKPVRAALAVAAFLGLMFSLLLYVPLAQNAGRWLKVDVWYHAIQYDYSPLPAFSIMSKVRWELLYVTLVFSPLVVSTARRLKVFFLMLAASAAISHIVYWYAFVSVWCFIASVLSAQLCFFFSSLEEEAKRIENTSNTDQHNVALRGSTAPVRLT